MRRTELDYLQELTVQLRLAGLDGRQVGAVLEEARDHLEASNETAEDAFGPVEDYAAELARSHTAAGTPWTTLTRGDLVAGGAQLGGWLLLADGLTTSLLGGEVVILAAHLAAWALLTAALVWPVWPTFLDYAAGRASIAKPTLAMTGVLALCVVLTMLWDSPPIVTLAPWTAIIVGVIVIGLCWLRVWFRRDPIRRPTDRSSADDA